MRSYAKPVRAISRGRSKQSSAKCFGDALERVQISADGPRIELDPNDPDGQSILVWYPTVTAAVDGYIRHGLRRWFDQRQVLRGGVQRVSRHYYDIHRLYHSDVGVAAIENAGLGHDCVRYASMFFDSADLDLASAVPGAFFLVPSKPMLAALQRDYDAMAGMIFGPVPPIGEVITSVAELEVQVNQLR